LPLEVPHVSASSAASPCYNGSGSADPGKSDHPSARAAASLLAWSDNTAGSFLKLAGGLSRDACFARHDVDTQIEYHLPAGPLGELLHGHAYGAVSPACGC